MEGRPLPCLIPKSISHKAPSSPVTDLIILASSLVDFTLEQVFLVAIIGGVCRPAKMPLVGASVIANNQSTARTDLVASSFHVSRGPRCRCNGMSLAQCDCLGANNGE